MDKHLQAELWEIQIILYLILATQVPWACAKIALCVWAAITFVGTLVILAAARIEDEQLKSITD